MQKISTHSENGKFIQEKIKRECLFTFSSYVLDVGFVNVFQSNFDSIRNMQIRCNCQRQTPIRFCEWESDRMGGKVRWRLWTTNLKATHKTLVNLSFVTRRCLIIMGRFMLSTDAVAGDSRSFSMELLFRMSQQIDALSLFSCGRGSESRTRISFITRVWFELQESSVEQKTFKRTKALSVFVGILQYFHCLLVFQWTRQLAWQDIFKRNFQIYSEPAMLTIQFAGKSTRKFQFSIPFRCFEKKTFVLNFIRSGHWRS